MITKSIQGERVCLKLEGKLVGAWVDECRTTCGEEIARGPLALDLTELTFVDGDGVQLLRQFVARGADVQHASNYVTELLRARGAAE